MIELRMLNVKIDVHPAPEIEEGAKVLVIFDPANQISVVCGLPPEAQEHLAGKLSSSGEIAIARTVPPLPPDLGSNGRRG